MIYSATAKGGFKMPAPFDPNSKKYTGVIYIPDTWAATHVYYMDDYRYDIVIPTVFKAKYYKVVQPGKSGATEPAWPSAIGEQVTDGDVIWECVAYDLIPPTDTISTSTFTASDGVTLTGASISGGKTQVKISAVPTGVTQFTVTNHTVRTSGEEDDVTLVFKVGER